MQSHELAKQFARSYAQYRRSRTGQPGATPPAILYIVGVDCPFDPSEVTILASQTARILRVPGGLVPPQGLGDIYMSGAIELVLSELPSIRHIVALAHTQCAFLNKLATGVEPLQFSNLPRLLAMADFARAQAATRADPSTDPVAYQRALLEAFVQRNVESLREIEIVRRKEQAGELTLHGWYIDTETGQLVTYDQQQRGFVSANEPAGTDVKPSGGVSSAEPEPGVLAAAPALAEVLGEASARMPDTPGDDTMEQVPSSAPQPLEEALIPVDVAPVEIPDVSPSPAAPAPVTPAGTQPVQRVYPSDIAPATAGNLPRAEKSSAGAAVSASYQSAGQPLDPVVNALPDLLDNIKRPAQRIRVRQLLNRLHRPEQWQSVQHVVEAMNTPDVRQGLREISIELTSPQARRELRRIISGLAPLAGPASQPALSEIQQEFLTVLERLQRTVPRSEKSG